MFINDSRLKNEDKSYSRTRIVLQETYIDDTFNNELQNVIDIYYEKFDNINNLIKNNLDKRIDRYIKWVYKNKKESTKNSEGEEKSVYFIGSRFRTLKRKNELSESMITKLNIVINDGYFWWKKEDPLQVNIKKYIEWMKQTNKNIIYYIKYPSSTSDNETEKFLGCWANEIRYIANNGRTKKLTEKEIKQFNDLGIYLYWKKDYFETNYGIALLWYERNKRIPMERRKDLDKDLDEDGKVEKKLYRWFSTLRSIKRAMKKGKRIGRHNPLNKEQFEKLDKLIKLKMFKWN